MEGQCFISPVIDLTFVLGEGAEGPNKITTDRAREEAEEKKEAERKQAAATAKAVFRAQLAEQIAERQAVRNGKKMEVATEELTLEEAQTGARLVSALPLVMSGPARHAFTSPQQ